MNAILIKLIDEAWLSLVERCVRDAEVAGSNPVASIRLREKTPMIGFGVFLRYTLASGCCACGRYLPGNGQKRARKVSLLLCFCKRKILAG